MRPSSSSSSSSVLFALALAAASSCLPSSSAAGGDTLTLMPPEHTWVRPGGSSVLSCRSSLPVSSCLWRTPKGRLFSLGEGQTAEGGRVAFEAKFEEGENVEEARRRVCGIRINNVMEEDVGEWECSVNVVQDSNVRTASGRGRLSLASAPTSVSVEPSSSSSTVNATAGESRALTCSVAGGRPTKPESVSWSVGGEEVRVEQDRAGGSEDGEWWQTVRFVPNESHSGKELRCHVQHPGFPEDAEEASSSAPVLLHVSPASAPADEEGSAGDSAGQSDDEGSDDDGGDDGSTAHVALAAGAACLALILAAVVVAAYVRNRRNNGQGEEGKDADAEKGEGDEEESEKEKSVGWWRSTFGFMLGSSAAAAASDVDGVKVKNAAYENEIGTGSEEPAQKEFVVAQDVDGAQAKVEEEEEKGDQEEEEEVEQQQEKSGFFGRLIRGMKWRRAGSKSEEEETSEETTEQDPPAAEDEEAAGDATSAPEEGTPQTPKHTAV